MKGDVLLRLRLHLLVVPVLAVILVLELAHEGGGCGAAARALVLGEVIAHIVEDQLHLVYIGWWLLVDKAFLASCVI